MSNQILTEKDLENIITNKKPRETERRVLRIISQVGAFLALTAAVFVAMNFSSIKDNLVFWYDNNFKNAPVDTSQSTIINRDIAENQQPALPSIPDNSILISAINVKTPITWRVENLQENVKLGLQNGVIHINSTALPGEIGNVFITGHSSNYTWAKGDYNSIFALLNKLVVGDNVQLKYQGTDYLYQVSDIKTVKPTEISVMKPQGDSRLTLMTCTPVGTSLNRLIVTAKQVYPDSKSNKPSTTASNNNSLPGVR